MKKSPSLKLSLTQKILFAMLFAIVIGTVIHHFKQISLVENYLINGIFYLGGTLFISLMKMLVIPVVFISLVCGTCALGSGKALGRMSIKAFLLYLSTTAIAISIGLMFAIATGIKTQSTMAVTAPDIQANSISLMNIFINIIPSNPFHAFANGDMLPIILFSLLLGIAIAAAGKSGEKVRELFLQLNDVIMQLIHMVILLTPYGVFCLIARLVSDVGFSAIQGLVGYFLIVIAALLTHLILTNACLLKIFAKLSPLKFFKKMYPAMIFAFSTSSSNVSIPVMLETVEKKLHVKKSIASFIIPLGATINMDGTAIMQGVATVFIANTYHIHLSISDFIMVVVTATLASIGTAGVPSVGLFMLAMVLQQVGLPVEGIGYIIGIDRILDMIRTAVNVTGDASIACVIARSENGFTTSSPLHE